MNHAEVKRRQLQAVSLVLACIAVLVLTRVLGYNGVAYMAAAMEAYFLVWTVVCGGLPDVLGRLLRTRNARGQYRNAARMRKYVLFLQMALGLGGSLLLFFGAGWIAQKVLGVQYGVLILMVLSPAVLLRSVTTVFLGYFQGDGSEFPTVVTGILRQLLILGFGLLFGRIQGGYGEKVGNLLGQENFAAMHGGVGVAIAVSLAEGLLLLFLLLLLKARRHQKYKELQDGLRAVDSLWDSVRMVSVGRLVQTGTSLLLLLCLPLGLLLFMRKGQDLDAAAVQYGVYIACYLVLCVIPAALTMVCVLPSVSKTVVCLRKEEQRFARMVFQGGMHMCVAYTAYMVAFLIVMASQAAAVFCPGQEQHAVGMLRGGSLLILLAVLSLYFARYLVLVGRKQLVLASAGAAFLAYVAAVFLLSGAWKVGALALVYAGLLGAGVLTFLLGALACRHLHLRTDWLQVLVVPTGAACITGFVGMLLGKLFTPHLGNLVALCAVFLITFALYWVLLLLVRNFREQELETVSGGNLIRALGQMLRVF